jgi:transcriptional regulator with GAF, ATPase, and Fis domain
MAICPDSRWQADQGHRETLMVLFPSTGLGMTPNQENPLAEHLGLRSDAVSRAEEAVSRSIARSVMESGREGLIGDASITEPDSRQQSIQQLSLRSVLCAPLVASDQAFALIYLENREVTNCSTEEQRDLLDEVCALAALRLRAAVAMSQAQRRLEALEHAASQSDGILTADAGMARVLQTVRQIATTDLPVLIEGETGTGKEVIARAVYRHSARVKVIALNCGAIPATLNWL